MKDENKSTIGKSFLHENGIPETHMQEIIDALPKRLQVTGQMQTRIVIVDGHQLLPDISQKVVNHSPGGFNWGYSGSGPAQLALAILLRYLPKEYAVNLYHSFKDNVVAAWPQDDFAMMVNLREEIQKILDA